LAGGVGPRVGDAVSQTIRRYRTRQVSHLNRYACQAYLESLLRTIFFGSPQLNPRRKRTMAALLNRIEAEPTRAWTLKDAATHLGVSLSHASKRFKATTGHSFVTYVTGKRIARAELMLRYTDMPVVRIAREVNFLPNYFSRVFKLTTGHTPTEFRDAGRE